MKALDRRLRRLEDQLRHAIEALHKSEGPPGFSPVEWTTQRLDEWGIVLGPNESLAEATARALGWTCPQLRNYLEGRAAGKR